MSESFLATHEKIDLSTFTIRGFSPEFYALAYIIARTRQPIPVIPNYREHVPITVITSMFEQILESELAHVRDHFLDKEVWMLEALILFGVYRQLPKRDQRRVIAIVGSMTQHRLTLALVGINRNDRERLIRLFNKRKHRKLWINTLSGAHAASNTLVDLAKHNELSVYTPTVQEDVLWGVDLFAHLLDGTEGVCVSVKSLLGRRSHWYISSKQIKEDTPPQCQKDWSRIAYGTRDINREYELDWHPLLALVGTKSQGFHQVPHQTHQRKWTNDLVRWLRARAEERAQALPGTSS